MASKSDIRKEYYKKEKKKRRENSKLAKLAELKSELESTIKNNSWYNPDRNPYLNRLSGDESEKYSAEKKKRFFLQYDIENLCFRKTGDSKSYIRNREKSFNKWYWEKDLFYRIQYFRIFRREFMRRTGEEPDKTNQLMNNCIMPLELNPESLEFRKDLLPLLDEGKDTDPKMEVLTPPEWAQKLIDEDSSDSYDSDFNGE